MTPQAIAESFRQVLENHQTHEEWQNQKDIAQSQNRWFEPVFINQSLNQWLNSLQPSKVEEWFKRYQLSVENPKTVGIIMAGNLPLVGFHDLLSVLVSGHNTKVKLSSEDTVLMKYWFGLAAQKLPELANRVEFADDLKNIDAAIATGSNNSARYFEYYFKNIPHVLRKNRNSVAVLHGNETPEKLEALGNDVFDYFGLGCRNVTHLFLPNGYDFKPLFDAWEKFNWIYNHNKYANNFQYHRALLLMNLDPHLDTGFLLVKEKPEIYSPVGMLNYSFYTDISEVQNRLELEKENIQCVVSEIEGLVGIPIGDAQNTELWDYADGVDTLRWLSQL